MNKYLLMSAAAVLAGTGAAHAGTHSFTFGTSNGNSYCDGGTIHTHIGTSDIVATWIHTNNNCASGTSQGMGILQKVKGLGKIYLLSDNIYAKNYGSYDVQLSYTVPKRIREGAEWTLWIGFSGVSAFEANSGKLKNVTAGAHGPKSHGASSTAAKVAQLIAAHRK